MPGTAESAVVNLAIGSTMSTVRESERRREVVMRPMLRGG
jgi:hypothetical protein